MKTSDQKARALSAKQRNELFEVLKGRTSVCCDREALDCRKEHKPKNSAMEMAAAMGIELLTEDQYREL